MNDKIKACCENCKMRGQYIYCDYFEYQKAICKRYDGDGQTPEQRIAELEAENAELKTRVKQFEHKEICVKENAEKLDAKKSEAERQVNLTQKKLNER